MPWHHPASLLLPWGHNQNLVLELAPEAAVYHSATRPQDPGRWDSHEQGFLRHSGPESAKASLRGPPEEQEGGIGGDKIRKGVKLFLPPPAREPGQKAATATPRSCQSPPSLSANPTPGAGLGLLQAPFSNAVILESFLTVAANSPVGQPHSPHPTPQVRTPRLARTNTWPRQTRGQHRSAQRPPFAECPGELSLRLGHHSSPTLHTELGAH